MPFRPLTAVLLAVAVLLAGCSGGVRRGKTKPAPAPVPPPGAPVDRPVAVPPPDAAPSAVPPMSDPAALPPDVIPSNTRELRVQVEVKLEGLRGVELWYTSDDGRSWFNNGLTEGKPKEVRFVAPTDGTYGFKVIPVDKDGKRPFTPVANTRPDATVLVDTQPPVVVLESPNGGNCFRNEGYELVSWTAADDHLLNNGIAIEASNDSGKTWVTIARNEPNDGKYFWKLPAAGSPRMRVRISAADAVGNVGGDDSDADFAVDGLAPGADFLGPKTSTRSEVPLQYRPWDLGGAGVSKVECWLTTDSGVHWERYGADDDNRSPMKVTLLDGVYGVRFVAIDAVGNASELPRNGVRPEADEILVVDTQPPQVKCQTFTDGRIYAGNHSYSIEWTSQDANSLKEPVTIEVSDDAGQSWQTVGKSLPSQGRLAWSTPTKQGKQYRLRVSALDALENTGRDTTPDFAVDPFVPEAAILGPAKSAKRDVEIEYEIRSPGYAEISLVELWFTTDNGATWHRYGNDPDLRSSITFSQPDGEYGLTLVCATELGKATGKRQREPRNGEPPRARITIDSQIPRVELRSFISGCYRGGEMSEVKWEVTDPHLGDAQVFIEVSDNGGETWYPIAPKTSVSAGHAAWRLPVETGTQYRLRLTVSDEFANTGTAVSSKDFAIDSLPPSGRAFGSPTADSLQFTVSFSAQESGPAGLGTIELWSTPMNDERHWERIAAIQGSATSFPVRVGKSGRYGFSIVAVDRVGNSMAIPNPTSAPDLEVLVDDEKPRIELLSFRGGEVFPGGSLQRIHWKAADNLAASLPIALDVSLDDGRSWKAIAENPQNTGEFLWTLPMESSDLCRLRLSTRDAVGNVGRVVSDSPFCIDSQRPLAVAQGPKVSPLAKVDLAYTVQDFGKAGVRSVTVWYRKGSEGPWERYEEFAGAKPSIVLDLPDGRYSICCTAEDTLGNAQEAPALKTAPQLELLVDSAAPVVEFTPVFEKGYVTGGDELEIRWKAEDTHFGDGPVSLWFSRNSGKDWEVLATSLKPSGAYVWNVPRMAAEACLLKAVARDTVDHLTEAVTPKPFSIVLGPPRLSVAAPPVSRDDTVELALSYDGAAPMASGEIWHTADGGKSWEALRTVEPGQARVSVALPDGVHGFRGVARDGLGNSGAAPAPGTRPTSTLLIDSTPPAVEFTALPEGGMLPLREGEVRKEIPIQWNATDEHLVADGLVLEKQEGSSDVWQTLGAAFPGKGSFTYQAPPREATYRFRISASDTLGNKSQAEMTVEVKKKVVEVTARVDLPVGGEVKAGGRVHAEWTVTGAEGTPALTWWLRLPGEKAPRTLLDRQPPQGSAEIVLPAEALDDAVLVLSMTDAAGKTRDLWRSAPFRIVVAEVPPTPPPVPPSPPPPVPPSPPVAGAQRVRLTIPRSSGKRPTGILFEPSTPGDGAGQVVDLYFTIDGGAHWNQYNGSVPATSRVIPFDMPDGTYGLIAVARDEKAPRAAGPMPGDAPDGLILIDTAAPVVTLKNFQGGDTYPGGTGRVVFWEARDAALAERPVGLSFSDDGGSSWQEIARGIPNTGQFLWTLPRATGRAYRLRVQAIDQIGNVGSASSPKDFAIDSTTPAPYVTGPRFSKEMETVLTWSAGDGPASSTLSRLFLWATEDGGAHWSQVAESVPPAPLTYKAMREGAVGLALVGRSNLGTESIPPAGGTRPPFELVIDRTAPKVEILTRLDGKIARGGTKETLGWKAEDVHLSPTGVAVDLSTDDGRNWSRLAKDLAAAGEFPITWPMTSSASCLLKVTAKDEAGNAASAVSGKFSLSSGSVAVKVSGPDRSVARTVRLAYTVEQTGIAKVTRVDLYWTTDNGQAWAPAGKDADLASPVDITVPSDGKYGFWITVGDNAGNSTPKPAPGANPVCTTLVDTKAPVVLLSNCLGGDVLQAGALHEVTWRAEDENLGPAPIALNVSADGGKSWQPLATAQKNTGRLAVSLPRENGATYRMQIVATDMAGNIGMAASVRDLVLDAAAPTATILGPASARTERIELQTKIEDVGPAGLAKVSLHISRDDGTTWETQPVEVGKPLMLTLRDGRYGLAISALDRAGNALPPPAPKSVPPFRLTVSASVPVVFLTSFQGADLPYRGGSLTPITWECKSADLAEKPIRLEWSQDGGATWSPIASDLTNSGSYDWKLPAQEVHRGRVRVTVTNAFGVTATQQSPRDFAVTVKAPTSSIIGIGKKPGKAGAGGQEPPQNPRGPAPKEPKETSEPKSGVTPPPGTTGGPEPPADPREQAAAALALGRTYYAERDYPQALKHLLEAVRLDPENGTAHYYLGCTRRDRHENEEAVKEFRLAAKLDPEGAAQALNDCGGVLQQRLGRLDEAERAYADSIAARDGAVVRYNLGSLYALRKNYAEAEKQFLKALEFDERMIPAMFCLGRAYADHGKPIEARKTLQKVLAMAPDSKYAAEARRLLDGLK